MEIFGRKTRTKSITKKEQKYLKKLDNCSARKYVMELCFLKNLTVKMVTIPVKRSTNITITILTSIFITSG